MSAIDKLFELDPFDFSDMAKECFRESMKECIRIHYEGCDYFKYKLDKENFSLDSITDEGSLLEIPSTMVSLFKEHEFISADKKDIVLTLGSSGTSGQRSLQHLNSESLKRVKKLAKNVYKSLGITSDKKYNYLCFTYDPSVADDLGTAFTDELLTSFTGINEIYYAIEYNEEIKDFKLNEKKVVETLKRFEKSPDPTRILGFPAFLYKIIKDHDIQINLGADSWVQIGGGWKDHSDKVIPKDEFREFVSKRLGLPKSNIRDLFGMVEHGIPYVDSFEGKLMIPNYARVYIRDPHTLKVVDDGEVGLIQFMCSYNTSYPAFNILSTDWGRVETDSLGAQSLEILGRAGENKHKGCALSANELLRK